MSDESPYCTSTALVDLLGRTRCDKQAGHDGWHRWQIEWQPDEVVPVHTSTPEPLASEATGPDVTSAQAKLRTVEDR